MKISAEQAANCRRIVSSFFRQTGSARDKYLSIWNFIAQNEVTLGATFIIAKPDRNLYVVGGATGDTLPLPRPGRGGDRIFSYLHTLYGLTEREAAMKVVYDAMRSFAGNHGVEVELRRFSAYDVNTQTAYISTYDGGMWKIDGGLDIKRVPNGTDEIFFIDDDGGKALPAPIDIAPHGLLLDYLTSINFATGMGGFQSELQRKALIVWIFSLAFPDLMPTKPLVILEGVQGAGKTVALKLIQIALLGEVKPLTLSKNQEADFGVLLLRSPICLLDNIDSYIDWVADKVCQYATGIHFTKRKLFSDDEEVSIKPHAFLAIASKNPASFRREDVADRCIVLRLDKRDKFKRYQRMVSETLKIRHKLLGEYIYYVNRIVEEIRNGAYDEDVFETHRMADFAALARIVGKIFDWSEEDVADLMGGIKAERDAFIGEEDPLLELLHRWITTRSGTWNKGTFTAGVGNVGREITINELFHELDTIAQGSSIQWYKGTRQLKQKIRSSHIERDFIVHTMTQNGRTTYRIWRHTDAQLSVVPDPGYNDEEPPLQFADDDEALEPEGTNE